MNQEIDDMRSELVEARIPIVLSHNQLSKGNQDSEEEEFDN